MRLLMAAGVVVAFAAVAQAQVRQQVFAGAGITVPRKEGASSTSVNGGYAVVIPIGPGWSLRPFVSAARVDPTTTGRPSFASLLAAALVIRRITPTFAILGGGGMTTSFPRGGSAQRLGVGIVSTNSRISDRWIMLTPVVISETGIGFNTQFAFIW